MSWAYQESLQIDVTALSQSHEKTSTHLRMLLLSEQRKWFETECARV